MFLKRDQERAEREQDCYGFLLSLSNKNYINSEFGHAADHLEEAARSLRELQKMKDDKKTDAEARALLKQIETRQEVDRIIAAMRLGK